MADHGNHRSRRSGQVLRGTGCLLAAVAVVAAVGLFVVVTWLTDTGTAEDEATAGNREIARMVFEGLRTVPANSPDLDAAVRERVSQYSASVRELDVTQDGVFVTVRVESNGPSAFGPLSTGTCFRMDLVPDHSGYQELGPC